jgi:hypothetical protein
VLLLPLLMQERIQAWRREQASKARQGQVLQQAQRQCAVARRSTAALLKERQRVEAYALNALLRMWVALPAGRPRPCLVRLAARCDVAPTPPAYALLPCAGIALAWQEPGQGAGPA